MKRVLAAGSAGHLGRSVVQEFRAQGHIVRAVARSPHSLDGLRDAAHEIFENEMARSGTVERACDSVDIVFSSISITKREEGLLSRDRDYQGNTSTCQVRGIDLTESDVDLLEDTRQEIGVGGLEILTYHEVDEPARQSLGGPAWITSVPVWITKLAIPKSIPERGAD